MPKGGGIGGTAGGVGRWAGLAFAIVGIKLLGSGDSKAGSLGVVCGNSASVTVGDGFAGACVSAVGGS